MTASIAGHHAQAHAQADDDALARPAESIDFGAFRDLLRRRYGIILASILIWPLAVAGALHFATPSYTAHVEILLDPAANKALGESILPDFSLEAANIDSQISVLRSTELLRRVVVAGDLAADPEFSANPKPNIWTQALNMLRRLDRSAPPKDDPGDAAPQNARSEQIAIGNLADALDAHRLNRTYVLALSVTAHAPNRAARVANLVARTYIQDLRDTRYEGARKASAWLSARLEDIGRDLRASELAVSDFRRAHHLISVADNGRLTTNEQQIADMNVKLAELRMQGAEARAKYEQAKAALAEGGVEALPPAALTPMIAQLRQKEAEDSVREADLRARYGEGSPVLSQAVADRAAINRAAVETAIKREMERIVASLKAEADVYRVREQALQQSLDAATTAEGVDDEVRVQLADLERTAASNRANYDYFLTRAKIAQEQTGFEQAGARLISPAAPPSFPSFPRHGPAALLSALFGAISGLALAAAIDSRDDRADDPAETQRRHGCRVIGATPDIAMGAARDQKHLDPIAYCRDNPLSHFAETIRALRIDLRGRNGAAPPKTVLFTSALPGEGKTTLALALADAARNSGLKVALIDADLRRPTLSARLDAGGATGLSEFLHQSPDEKFGLEQGELTLFPAGAPSARTPDLLDSRRMRNWLELLRETFDLIVIDAPPLSIAADAKALATQSDMTILVSCRLGRRTRILTRAIASIRPNARQIELLLNRVDDKIVTHDTLSAYDHYGLTDKRRILNLVNTK